MSSHAISSSPAPASRSTRPDVSDLPRELHAALTAPGYRPPLLPAVALEVTQLSGRQDVDLGMVVQLLERDPVLAARVLAAAQSFHYARRSPVLTLRQAAVRLGLETLGPLALQAALELQVFRAKGFEAFATRLGHHATAVAHVTRDVCKRARIPGDQAFTCGLLHDVGLSACLQVIASRPAWAGLPFEALAPVLDAVHTEASGLLVRAWKLPDAIAKVVESHHQVVVEGVPQPINAALVVAEQLCWELGAGLLPPPRHADAGSMEGDLPEQPLEGLDTNWPSLVQEAMGLVGFDAEALVHARAAAGDLLSELGLGERLA
jgi:HD-like signal output (HDOD) protein